MNRARGNGMCFVRPNPDTPCVMWRTSVTSAPSPLPESRGLYAVLRTRRATVGRKKTPRKKLHDVQRVPHRPKRRARRGDRPLERAFEVGRGPNKDKCGEMEKREGEKKEKKERDKQTKQGTFPPPQYSRPPARAVNGKVMFATGESRGARGNADGRVSPI